MPYNITKDDSLYRRIPRNNPNCWKNIGGKKVLSSFKFKTKPHEDGLSVNIAALVTPEIVVARHPNNDIASFLAAVPIDEGYSCIQKGPDPSHAIIEGDTNPIAKKLANSVTRVFDFNEL
jgi:hypothetical protein